MPSENCVGTITSLIRRTENGEAAARDELLQLAYPDLRRLAQAFLGRARGRYSEAATALVHRVCERLLARESVHANDRRHFFRLFGRMMHDVLVDEIRAAAAQKRGGLVPIHSITPDVISPAEATLDLIDLRDAMAELRNHDSDAAEAVNLRFFCGQTLEQAAETMACSFAAIRQHADYGVAWLRARLRR